MINYTYDAQPTCLILFGQSLGATLALYAAADPELKPKLRAVVADSPFSDYRGIVREKLREFWIAYLFSFPLALLVNNSYSPLPHLADIAPLPLLLIHSAADQIVPISRSG